MGHVQRQAGIEDSAIVQKLLARLDAIAATAGTRLLSECRT